MSLKIFKNAKTIDCNAESFCLSNIVVNDNIIIDIQKNTDHLPNNTTIIDMHCKMVIKPFCDYHLHIPASFLYDTYGVNLSQCASMREIRKKLIAGKRCGNLIRGFGWDIGLLNNFFKKNRQNPLAYLDHIFPEEIVILFSVDFHTCWCNSNAIKELKKYHLKTKKVLDDICQPSNCFYDGHIAAKIFDDNVFSFSDDEIRSSILKQQSQLLRYGIKEVNTFMFIGATRMRVLRVLWKMDQEKELLININCCYDMYPYMSLQNLEKQIRKSKKYCSKHMSFKWIKIYMDGVIENHTAFLKKQYSDKKTAGKWPSLSRPGVT